jgi:hypothetical protein
MRAAGSKKQIKLYLYWNTFFHILLKKTNIQVFKMSQNQLFFICYFASALFSPKIFAQEKGNSILLSSELGIGRDTFLGEYAIGEKPAHHYFWLRDRGSHSKGAFLQVGAVFRAKGTSV